jgi:23S rRNA (cytosine1962-C5)-methyltransferase
VQELIADALMGALEPRGIYERNDAQVRELEGFPCLTETAGSCPTDTEIEENGVRSSWISPQDRKRATSRSDEKPFLRSHLSIAGKRVLDAFCHTRVRLHAAHYGLSEVLTVDISLKAIQYLHKNAELNASLL